MNMSSPNHLSLVTDFREGGLSGRASEELRSTQNG